MKILLIGDFRREYPRFMVNNPRIFSKGFVRNGHDVLNFSYRNELMGLSPLNSKKFAITFAKKKTDKLLHQMAVHYQPDIIMIMAFKLLDADTIRLLKESLPQAIVMCWYCDPYEGIDPKIAPIALECDWFCSTSAGAVLHQYKQLGVKHCAFIPNASDPDIEHPRSIPDKWKSSVLFTGKLRHNLKGQDTTREHWIRHLVDNKNVTTWGCLGHPFLEGADYLNAICGAKIAVSINTFNNMDKYHSDRLTHYISCGCFTLAKYVPKSEMLFEDKKHLCYFETLEQCSELIDHFLQNESQRTEIAQAGMRHAHKEFGCQIMAKHIIDIAEKGDYQAIWREIV